MSDKKILIVDDEAAIRSLLRTAVTGPDLTIFEADGASQALAVAAEHAPFELVVTDVLMPEMDGIELARQLMRQGHADRFLFISGYCDLETAPERIREFGAAAFLGKPFAIPDLLHTVRALLTGRPRGGAVQRKGSRSA